MAQTLIHYKLILYLQFLKYPFLSDNINCILKKHSDSSVLILICMILPKSRYSFNVGLMIGAKTYHFGILMAVKSHLDIQYCSCSPPCKDHKHQLDLFAPSSSDYKKPLIVFVHGGGWQRGDRRAANYFLSTQDVNWMVYLCQRLFCDCYSNVGQAFAEAGYVCLVPSYRLSTLKMPFFPLEVIVSAFSSFFALFPILSFMLHLMGVMYCTVSILVVEYGIFSPLGLFDDDLHSSLNSFYFQFVPNTEGHRDYANIVLFILLLAICVIFLTTRTFAPHLLGYSNAWHLFLKGIAFSGVLCTVLLPSILSSSFFLKLSLISLELSIMLTVFGAGIHSCYYFNHSKTGCIHPDHTDDILEAIQWSSRNGDKYCYDDKNVFLVGHSAGAHICSLLATDCSYLSRINMDNSSIKGVIAWSGIYNLISFNSSFLKSKLYVSAAFNKNHLKNASPITHISSSTPPFLLINAEQDAGLEKDAEKFYEALNLKCRNNDQDDKLVTIKGTNHLSLVTTIQKNVNKSDVTQQKHQTSKGSASIIIKNEINEQELTMFYSLDFIEAIIKKSK